MSLYRLRRAVLHPHLVLSPNEGVAPKASSGNGAIDVKDLIQKFSEGENAVGDNKVYAEGVLANLAQEEGAECPICFDVMETPAIMPDCMHQWYVATHLSMACILIECAYSCKDCIIAFIEKCREKGEDGKFFEKSMFFDFKPCMRR